MFPVTCECRSHSVEMDRNVSGVYNTQHNVPCFPLSVLLQPLASPAPLLASLHANGKQVLQTSASWGRVSLRSRKDSFSLFQLLYAFSHLGFILSANPTIPFSLRVTVTDFAPWCTFASIGVFLILIRRLRYGGRVTCTSRGTPRYR